MAENRQKIKLIKLYELLRKETDEDHPISRVELCKRLNEMGISSNVRTLSLDIEVLTENGFEIESFLKDKEKFYYVPEHELTIMDELGYDVELTYRKKQESADNHSEVK